jgi:hypothetical protein
VWYTSTILGTTHHTKITHYSLHPSVRLVDPGAVARHFCNSMAFATHRKCQVLVNASTTEMLCTLEQAIFEIHSWPWHLNLMQQFRWCCDDNWPRYCHCRSSCHGKTGGAPPNVDWNHRCSVKEERDGKSTCWCIWQSLGNALDEPKVYWSELVLVLQLELSCPRPFLPNDSMFLIDHELRRFSQIIHPTHTSRQGQVRSDFFGAIWYN